MVGRVSVGTASDSNPARLGEDFTVPEGFTITGIELPVQAGETPVPADQEESLALGSLRLGFHPVFDRGGWSAAVELEARGTRHQDVEPLDHAEGRVVLHLVSGGDPSGFVTGPLGSTRVPRDNGRLGLLLQLGAARNLLNGERHVTGLEAAGALIWRGAPHATTRIEVLRSELELGEVGTDFLDAPVGDFSWDETAAGLVQSFFLGRRDRVLRLAGHTGERAGDPSVEGSFLSGHAGLDLVLARRWALFLGLELRQDDYDHPDSNPFWPPIDFDPPDGVPPGVERPPRDETTWRASALLVQELPAGLRLTASVQHEDREAEKPVPTVAFDPLTYDRTVATLSLGWRFGREGRP